MIRLGLFVLAIKTLRCFRNKVVKVLGELRLALLLGLDFEITGGHKNA